MIGEILFKTVIISCFKARIWEQSKGQGCVWADRRGEECESDEKVKRICLILKWSSIFDFAQKRDWNWKAGEAEAEDHGYSSEEEGLKSNKADQDFKE